MGCNAAGRDFVAGDIHGCFSTLEAALAELRPTTPVLHSFERVDTLLPEPAS